MEYIKNSRNFTPNNYSQAMLPEGCTVFQYLRHRARLCLRQGWEDSRDAARPAEGVLYHVHAQCAAVSASAF